MNHELIRDAILGLIGKSDATIKMFPGPVLVADHKAWVENLKGDEEKVIFGWVTREAISETQTKDASDTSIISLTQETWAWYIFMPFAEESEAMFQGVLDSLMKRFRFEYDLDGKAHRSQPLALPDIAMVTLGNVLCHRARILLTVQQRLKTTEST